MIQRCNAATIIDRGGSRAGADHDLLQGQERFGMTTWLNILKEILNRLQHWLVTLESIPALGLEHT